MCDIIAMRNLWGLRSHWTETYCDVVFVSAVYTAVRSWYKLVMQAFVIGMMSFMWSKKNTAFIY